MWFDVRLTGDPDGLEAQLVGALPGSEAAGEVESPRVKVRWLPPLPTGLVRLSLVKAQGSGSQGRERIFRCTVVFENRTRKPISWSYSVAPFDGLLLTLRRGDVTLARQIYGVHLSSLGWPGLRYTLKPGKTKANLIFPVDFPPGDWEEIEAQVSGSLSESRFPGHLRTQWVKVRDRERE